MKKIAVAILGLFFAGSSFATPDWSKVDPIKMTLFFPGQASLEWALDKAEHSAAPDIIEKKQTCAKCHMGDANEVGEKIVAGKPAGNKKAPLEPKPVAGRGGHVPVLFQAAHDGNKIYFRLEWETPKTAGEKMDAKNDVKATIMFDGGGTVDGANQNGCWATCHDDLRTMKTPKSDEKKKYIKDANLDAGKFYDYIQFRSGKGEPMIDGYIAEDRVREGGKSLVKAEGKKDGNKWVVTFERELAGKGKGDHNLAAGKIYNFGVAIHEGATNARFHYISLGYQFGLDADAPKDDKGRPIKNYYKVSK